MNKLKKFKVKKFLSNVNRPLLFYQPPRTGRYTFYLSGDDQCRLAISTDYTKRNLRMIAMFPKGLWTKRNQWNK